MLVDNMSFPQDKISGSPHTRNEAANTTVKLDYQYMHEEERNYSFFGKKDEKSQILSPLRDDINITRDDDMAKVCCLLLVLAVSLAASISSNGRV